MSQYRFTIVGKDATKAMFRSIRTGLKGVRSGINSTQVKFAALAGVAGMGAIVNSSRQAIDVLAKTSSELGITTEKLATLQHAAQLPGSTNESLSKGLKKLQKSIGDANNGLSTYTRAFDKLKLDPAELQSMTPDEQFRKVGEAMAGVGTQTERVAIAYDLLGGRNTALLNTMVEVGDNFEGLEKEVQDYGLAISRVDAAKVEEANDQLLRVGQVVKGLGQKLTVKLAPMISVISEKLIGAATEGDRMGRIVTKGIGFAIKAAGIFMDGLRGVKVIFAAVQVAATLFATGLIGAFTGVALAVTRVVQSIKAGFAGAFAAILTPLAKLSDTADEVLTSIRAQIDAPFTDPPFLVGMKNMTAALAEDAAIQREALQALLLQDLPSAVFEQKWAEIQAEAEQRAQETAARIEAGLAGGGDQGGGGPIETDAEREKREAKAQREREQIAARLQRLDESYMTEFELLELKIAREYELSAQARARGVIDQEEYEQRIADIKAHGEKAQTDLQKKGEKSRAAIVASSMGSLASAFAGGSKKQFKVQKAAALAQAAVAVPASVLEAVKNAGGLPFGAWAGAATLTAGIAQIANIKKQTFAGGGSVSNSMTSGGGSSSTSPANASLSDPSVGSQFSQKTEQAEPGRQVNITIAGDVVGDTAETILDKMRVLIEENDAVLFSSNSRQAAELGAG